VEWNLQEGEDEEEQKEDDEQGEAGAGSRNFISLF
jgi:hypothetical protein